jgi:glycosyltransferase involved in cell wall biosynthesis
VHGPTVSVIIPVYNGEKHLAATLDTVLAQTQLPDEIVLVDDGSTDGSAELLDRLSVENSMTVIHQPNAGQSAARNAAAKVATGDLLAFLDQDDHWYPEHLEKLTRCFIARPRVGWAHSDFDEMDGEGRIVAHRFMRAYKVVHPKYTIPDLLQQDLMIVPSAAIIRATAFNSVGGFDPQLCGYEDDDLFIRLFQAGWYGRFINRSLTRFRVHPGSSSGSGSFQESRVKFLDKLIEEFPNNPRLNRHYIRDLVFPRLFRATLGEYAAAVSMGDRDRARWLADILTTLAERVPGGPWRAMGLALLRRPRVFQILMATYRHVPRWIRPQINSSFAPNMVRVSNPRLR